MEEEKRKRSKRAMEEEKRKKIRKEQDRIQSLMQEEQEQEENPINNNNKKEEEIEKKAKSCKGCLYYSSSLRSNSHNPLCVGISRSLPQVPRHLIGEAEVEASKEGRSITDFKYGCLGYSVYSYEKDLSSDVQGSKELPVCVGLEVLVDKRVNAPGSVPAHARNKEDTHVYPQTRTQKPAHPLGEEFMSRFSRNATVVANGVVKNVRKVGNHIKDRVDDILYPYRRRPK